MALTLRRVPEPNGGPGELRPAGVPGQTGDDYIIETEATPARPPASLLIVRVLQAILIAAIALLSLAVFWMVGLLLGIL
jgi:hypothetical protein